MKKSTVHIGILIFIFFYLSACKKLIEIPEPKTQVSTTTVFSDIQTAEAAVLGLYSQMMKSEGYLENGGLSIYGGLLADDIITPVSNPQYDAFQNNTLTAQDYTVYSNFWYSTYSNIYQANSIIEGLQNANSLNQEQRNALVGEAKIVRSFYYFYLVNLFGAVPLITSTDYEVNTFSPRTSVDSIYYFLVEDLSDAEQLLPASYKTSDRTRPSSLVASAFLSRVHLFMANWDAAIQEATKVINSPGLSLIASAEINNTFFVTSAEIIWQLPQVIPNQVNSVEGELFIPNPGDVPLFTLTNSLMSSFETSDLRRTNWIDSAVIDNNVYYYPYKYKTRYSADKNENNIILRLAEQYLIRCEANMKLNKIEESVQDLNVIRERAGLADLPVNISQQELENNIAVENRHEYFAEFGHRWLDLKRNNSIDSVLSAEKGTYWQPSDSLLPIPFSEIQKNKNLVQNPGY